MIAVVIIVAVVIIYVAGRNGGKRKVRDDMHEALTGKRRRGGK